MDKGSDLAQLIQSYVTVQVSRKHDIVPFIEMLNIFNQYNTLLDLVKSPNADFYSPRWQGPSATKFIPWGQFTAANVMNAALSMALKNTTRISDTK